MGRFNTTISLILLSKLFEFTYTDINENINQIICIKPIYLSKLLTDQFVNFNLWNQQSR